MDTSRLERFAKYARRYLIEQVGNKLQQVLAVDSDARRYYPKQMQAMEDEIRRTNHLTPNSQPLSPLAERVAYTWFNRFCALRFMDVNGYNKVNVISPLPGHFQPEILEEAKAGHIDEKLVSVKYRTLVFNLLSGKETHPDPQSEAYRILVRSVCNYYADTMPFLFERIEDWTELLMPDDLLSGNSILAYTREAMVPGVCKDVEVIGWLYQYYIAERKSEVQEGVKKGKKVQSKDIPAVTQLFTPHWIVKYMVQNSLGRLWVQNHPNSTLKDKMEYYIGVANSDLPHADSEIGIPIKSPEEIKFCDPCCGSGHILTYAFDLLYDIYSEEGYDPIEIPRLIISKNLYGIEIDERASELAAFALAMKAREKDKAWFSRGLDPNICKLENISFSNDEIDPYLDRCGRDIFTLNFERMLSQFEYADTFGSLIVPFEQDIETISETLNARDFSGDVFLAPTHNKVLQLLKQADYLSTKYQVVVTNPPYLGTSGFGKEKETWFKTNYPNSRSDFFAMFMERCLSLSVSKGYMAMINMQSWMFLSSYEKLRKDLVNKFEFSSMAHLGPRAFDSIGGEVVSTTSFVIQNKAPGSTKGAYFRLLAGRSEDEKSNLYLQAIANPDCGYFFRIASSEFKKIPGAPIAYWVSERIREIFATSPALESVANAKQGLATADNDRFLRYWFETELHRIGFSMASRQEAKNSGKKWFPYNKGGEFRKWYGNQEYVVNWENDGEEIRAFCFDNGKQRSVVRNPDFYFRESVSWSDVNTSSTAFRHYPIGFIFDSSGHSSFYENCQVMSYVLKYTNTKILRKIVAILNPTIHFHVGYFNNVPVITPDIDKICAGDDDLFELKLVENEQLDWDSFETSWDFSELPLLGVSGLGVRDGEALKPKTQNPKPELSEAYAKLRERWKESTLKMQELEEENNRIFIEAYGLQEELSPEVPLKEITLTCNPYYRYGTVALLPSSDARYGSCTSEVNPTSDEGITWESRGNHVGDKQASKMFPLNQALEDRLLADTMKEFISYAVGCMFGRYSLDKPGLILANQGETLEDYLIQVPDPSFMPDKDNVIPVLEGEWFDDDVVSRFYEFLKVAFGADHFSQNLGYIEEAIGKDIRGYFIKDFYNDHIKRYKKRPIYWLFSSPSGSFNALIYMHRYTPDTASIILSDYLREYVFKLKNKAAELEKKKDSEDSTQKEKILAGKELDKVKQIISELEYWERDALYPAATQKLSIDLDDGVKVNYARFSKVLKRIPGLE